MSEEFLAGKYGRASDEEALRFILLYLQINEPERRRDLMDLAERFLAEAAPQVLQDNAAKHHRD